MSYKATVVYTGDGTQTTYSFGFEYLKKSFVKVQLLSGIILTYGVDYTILSHDVVFVTAPTGIFTVYRETDSTPLVSWLDASILKAVDMNLTQIQQEHIIEESSDKLSRTSMVVNEATNQWEGRNLRLTNVANPVDSGDVTTKGYIEGVQSGLIADITAVKNSAVATIEGLQETVPAELVQAKNDAVTAKNAAAISETNASTSAGEALASKNAAAISETNAANSETAAGLLASNANTSAGVATTQAGIATTGAETATAKASEALSSANAAGVSETNAGTSASNASTSAAAALMSEGNASASAVTATKQANNAANSANAANLSAQSTANIAFTTKALMDADLAHDANVLALVTNDTTSTNNGIYIKLLARGTGSWKKSAYVPPVVDGSVTTTKIVNNAVTAVKVTKRTFPRFQARGNAFHNTLSPKSLNCVYNMITDSYGTAAEIVSPDQDFEEYGAETVLKLIFNNMPAGSQFCFTQNGVFWMPIADAGLVAGDTFTAGAILKLITVASGRTFRIAITQTDAGNNYISGSALYSNYSTANDLSIVRLTGTVLPTTAYIRVFVSTSAVADGENLELHVANWVLVKGTANTDVYVNATDLEAATSNLGISTKDKNWLVFGDSITTSQTPDENGDLVDTNGRICWTTYSRDYLQVANMFNYAVSGAAYRYRTEVTPYQTIAHQIEMAIVKNRLADFIVIAAGTNDWVNVDDNLETAMAIATYAELDNTKLFQAMRAAFWRIRMQYPNALCFCGMPIQRQASEQDPALMAGLKTIAQHYNFIIIDGEHESGIIREFEVANGEGRFLHDGLHPNDAGYRLMSKLYNRVILNTFAHQMASLD